MLRKHHSPALCQRVIEDYERFSAENDTYVKQNLDPIGREKRLVNFHLWSEAEAALAIDERVMQALDFFFRQEAAVYSSLTFKYGTQQPVHRDTPHFATWPEKMFVGVWTALEDVDPKAGPLFYHPRAQRFSLDRRVFMQQANLRMPGSSATERAGACQGSCRLSHAAFC